MTYHTASYSSGQSPIRRMKNTFAVPARLRFWFVVHFVVDMVFALPLLLAPAQLLGALGFANPDPATSRLVGAALTAIGVQSLLGCNHGAETYRAMLNLKIIWSATASLGLLLAIRDGAPPVAWAFLAIFLAFNGLWVYYRVQLSRTHTEIRP